jgi:hypothetical protein
MRGDGSPLYANVLPLPQTWHPLYHRTGLCVHRVVPQYLSNKSCFPQGAWGLRPHKNCLSVVFWRLCRQKTTERQIEGCATGAFLRLAAATTTRYLKGIGVVPPMVTVDHRLETVDKHWTLATGICPFMKGQKWPQISPLQNGNSPKYGYW